MTSIINGFTIQKSTKTSYDTGQPCDCFSCSSFTSVRNCGQTDGMDDWEFGHDACCFTCPNKKQCAKPDKQECTIGVDSHQRDPLTKVTWNGTGPKLKCIYDIDKINTLEQIDNFKQKFGVHGDYNSIVGNYCKQSSDTCIVDPSTGKNMPKCSRLKSTGKDGELCRDWFNQQPKSTQDTVVQSYCGLNNTPDCKCVNRAQDEVYTSLKSGKVINDGCWYSACANPQVYLQTTDIENPSCPANFCDVIFNIAKDHNVDVNHIQNDVNCVFKNDPSPPKPIPPIPPKPGDDPKPKPDDPKPKPDEDDDDDKPKPKPGPPEPLPGPNSPTSSPFDLKKNYLILVVLVIIIMLTIFKGTRDFIFGNVVFGSVFVVILGVNTYILQKFLNDKYPL